MLGIGGDNSPWAAGTFFEGVMTLGPCASILGSTGPFLLDRLFWLWRELGLGTLWPVTCG